LRMSDSEHGKLCYKLADALFGKGQYFYSKKYYGLASNFGQNIGQILNDDDFSNPEKPKVFPNFKLGEYKLDMRLYEEALKFFKLTEKDLPDLAPCFVTSLTEFLKERDSSNSKDTSSSGITVKDVHRSVVSTGNNNVIVNNTHHYDPSTSTSSTSEKLLSDMFAVKPILTTLPSYKNITLGLEECSGIISLLKTRLPMLDKHKELAARVNIPEEQYRYKKDPEHEVVVDLLKLKNISILELIVHLKQMKANSIAVDVQEKYDEILTKMSKRKVDQ